MRILYLGPKAPDQGDSINPTVFGRILMFMWASGPQSIGGECPSLPMAILRVSVCGWGCNKSATDGRSLSHVVETAGETTEGFQKALRPQKWAVLLLMIRILHDLIDQTHRNYGSIVDIR